MPYCSNPYLIHICKWMHAFVEVNLFLAKQKACLTVYHFYKRHESFSHPKRTF